MNSRGLWIPALVCLFALDCSCTGTDEHQLLAVGGIHVFEKHTSCNLVRAEPEDAVTDLAWAGTLALEAKAEGAAEVRCGDERILVDILTPVRLEIEFVDGRPKEIVVDERFKVRARLYDRQARELEVGKFTVLDWSSFDILAPANDSSAGEFGLCDTCHGRYGFRATKPGSGWISTHLGSLTGLLKLKVSP